MNFVDIVKSGTLGDTEVKFEGMDVTINDVIIMEIARIYKSQFNYFEEQDILEMLRGYQVKISLGVPK
jgi:hypothetical protein